MRIQLKRDPKHGEARLYTRFAWFPVTIGYESRWLEKVTTKQTYRLQYNDEYMGKYYWEDDNFEEVE